MPCAGAALRSRQPAFQRQMADRSARKELAKALLFALFLVGMHGCSESPENAASPQAGSTSIEAKVYKVVVQEWPQTVATQGNLIADETTVVGAKVAGRIEAVPVDLGDSVRKGDVLASLDRRELEERMRQAEAELTQVRAAIGLDADDDLSQLNPNSSPVVVEQKALWDQALADRERVEGLRSRQAATESQLESVIATEQVAKARHSAAINSVRQNIALVRVRTAQLELARQELEDAVIRAPFDGRIQDRQVAPGSFIQVGDPVATLIRDDPLRYQGTVPEIYAPEIKVNQQVRLRTSKESDLPEVKITRISPSLDPFSRSLLFEAIVPNPDKAIQAGQFAQGEVVLDQSRQVLALPRSAIVEFAGTQKVWKVMDDQAVEHSVETGIKRGELVQVLQGLDSGDVVLIDGKQGRKGNVEIQEFVTIDANSGIANLRTGAQW